MPVFDPAAVLLAVIAKLPPLILSTPIEAIVAAVVPVALIVRPLPTLTAALVVTATPVVLAAVRLTAPVLFKPV